MVFLQFIDSAQRSPKYLEQNILDAARQVMREQGVAALTMQELARRMGMRAPSLYHYFSSKMDVYDALFRYGFTLYGEHMQQYLRGGQPWQEFIRGGFEGYLTFAMQYPDLYQLCFERPVPGFTPSEKSLQASFEILNRVYRMTEAYREAIDTDLPVQQLTDLVITMIHGITALHIANEPDLPIGEGRFGSLIPAALGVLEKAWSRT